MERQDPWIFRHLSGTLFVRAKDTCPRKKVTWPVARNQAQEDQREAHPDLMTLRVEYTALSHQLAQLDVQKQAGQ